MRTPFVHANEYSHGNHSRRSVIRSPVIDRNPQSFIANIARAKPADYVKATQKVCAGSKILLPVVR